jgi:V/A-type H+-transporting ATPase subunit B
VYGRDGDRRLGRVVDLAEKWAAIQIFGSSSGLSADDGRVEFLGRPMELRVGPGLMGRVFDGLGRPTDGYGEIYSSDRRDVNGLPINPYARKYPRDFIRRAYRP